MIHENDNLDQDNRGLIFFKHQTLLGGNSARVMFWWSSNILQHFEQNLLLSAEMATNLNDTISYLLKKSLHYVENNEYSFAKCYLLTANTLAADNIMIKVWCDSFFGSGFFQIFFFKFETFSMCKMENNVQDAVKVFTDLFCSAKFDQPTKKDKKDYDELKKMFTVEMKNILHAIKHEWRQCVSPQETEQFFTNQDLPLTTINFYRNVFHALKSENQIK